MKCDFCNIEVISLAQKTEHMVKKHPQQLREQVSCVNHDLLLTKTYLPEVIIWIEYKPIEHYLPIDVVFFLQDSKFFFDVINKNLNGKNGTNVDKGDHKPKGHSTSHKKGKMLKDITEK